MPDSSSNRAGPLRRLGASIAVAALAGCAQQAVDRPGTWQATGANDQNLRAMLVDQNDAYRGRAALTTRGDSSARAVTRLLVDKRRPLLNASVSRVAPGDTSGDSGGAALPSGGSGGSSGGGTQ